MTTNNSYEKNLELQLKVAVDLLDEKGKLKFLNNLRRINREIQKGA